jgi:ABC-type dipeptide/oligopeptide/nickel transport system permease component
MTKYVATRLLLAVPTLAAVSVIVFAAMRAVPGDPIYLYLGTNYDPELARGLRHDFGLDQPLPVQYLRWAGHLATGDWGTSIFSRTDVLPELLRRAPVSVELVMLSMCVAMAVAVPLGVIAATHRGSRLDVGLMTLSVLGISAPEFLVATLLMLVFALKLGWFGTAGFVRMWDDPAANLRSLALPALALGLARAALLSRLVRNQMIEILSQDYIRTARAKGLRERLVLRRHALRAALVPVITVAGLQFAALLGGAVVVETVFSIPGLGSYGITAMQRRDFPAIQGFVLLVSAGFVLMNILTDVACGLLDPLISFSREGSR